MDKSSLDKDGIYYEGESVDGLEHGQGIKLWPNGMKHEGEFVKGKCHG